MLLFIVTFQPHREKATLHHYIYTIPGIRNSRHARAKDENNPWQSWKVKDSRAAIIRSMTITILLSRRIIRSVPLLKGKKAEAPNLSRSYLSTTTFPPLPVIAWRSLIDRPFLFTHSKKNRRTLYHRREASAFNEFLSGVLSWR